MTIGASAEHAERVLRGARRRGDRFIEVGFRIQFPARYMLADRPDDGVRDVDDALASWTLPEAVEPISNQFYWAWRSRVMLALYAGRVDADAEWHRRRIPSHRREPALASAGRTAGRLDLGRCMVGRAGCRGTAARRLRPRPPRPGAPAHKMVAASPLPARAGSLQSFRAAIAHSRATTTRRSPRCALRCRCSRRTT